MIPIAGFERRLEQVFRSLAKGDDWEHILRSDSGDFHIRSKSATSLLVSYSYKINMSFDRAKLFIQPEAMCLPGHPFREKYLHEGCILKSFAPGDVIVSWRCRRSFAVLFHLLVARMRAPAAHAQDSYVARLTLRRDFPSVGEVSVVMVDLQDYDDSGLVLSGTEHPSQCQLKEVFEMPRLSPWLLKIILRTYCRGCDWPSMFSNVSALMHQTIEEEAGFLVVALKKCCRGPPLVPFTASPPQPLEPLHWMPQDDPAGFSLSRYLQLLLIACGLDSGSIFDSLDGRYLVPFHAAVKRSVWPVLWQTLDIIFKEQRSAYRRHYGGSGAPHIQADVAPRFHTETAAMQVSESSECPGLTPNPDEGASLEIKNTFIHFARYEYQCDEVSAP